MTGDHLFSGSDVDSARLADIIISIDKIAARRTIPFVHTSFSVPNDPGRSWKEEFLIEAGEKPDVRTTMAFTLDNSPLKRPEFVMTGADPDFAEAIMTVCNSLWDWLRSGILNGTPIVIDDRLNILLPVTHQGLQALHDGVTTLKAADMRVQAAGVDAPNWVQIVHADDEGRFPWDAGHSSILFQPIAGQVPQQHPGSEMRQ